MREACSQKAGPALFSTSSACTPITFLCWALLQDCAEASKAHPTGTFQEGPQVPPRRQEEEEETVPL